MLRSSRSASREGVSAASVGGGRFFDEIPRAIPRILAVGVTTAPLIKNPTNPQKWAPAVACEREKGLSLPREKEKEKGPRLRVGRLYVEADRILSFNSREFIGARDDKPCRNTRCTAFSVFLLVADSPLKSIAIPRGRNWIRCCRRKTTRLLPLSSPVSCPSCVLTIFYLNFQ